MRIALLTRGTAGGGSVPGALQRGGSNCTGNGKTRQLAPVYTQGDGGSENLGDASRAAQGDGAGILAPVPGS